MPRTTRSMEPHSSSVKSQHRNRRMRMHPTRRSRSARRTIVFSPPLSCSFSLRLYFLYSNAPDRPSRDKAGDIEGNRHQIVRRRFCLDKEMRRHGQRCRNSDGLRGRVDRPVRFARRCLAAVEYPAQESGYHSILRPLVVLCGLDGAQETAGTAMPENRDLLEGNMLRLLLQRRSRLGPWGDGTSDGDVRRENGRYL